MLHIVHRQSLFDKNTANGAPLALLTTSAAMHGKKVTIRTSENLLYFNWKQDQQDVGTLKWGGCRLSLWDHWE